MQNSKTGGSRWVPDIRPENIDTYTEQDGGQSTQYKIVDAHPIIGGVLDRLAFFRTHASAVWYNKMKNITVLQKIDNLAANIGTLAQLATTDKTSLVNAINELNVNLNKATAFETGTGVANEEYIDSSRGAIIWYIIGRICIVDYTIIVTNVIPSSPTIFVSQIPASLVPLWVEMQPKSGVSGGESSSVSVDGSTIKTKWRSVEPGEYNGSFIYFTK